MDLDQLKRDLETQLETAKINVQRAIGALAIVNQLLDEKQSNDQQPSGWETPD